MKQNLLCLMVLLLLAVEVIAEPQTLTLNSVSPPPLRKLFEMVSKEAFGKLGLNVKIQPLSGERALQNANEGIDDGDGLRIDGLDKLYPNLIQIPEKYIDVEFVAFSKNPEIKIINWESLKPYNVGFLIGWKILEENVINTKSLNKVKDGEVLFKLLEEDRIEVALYHKFDGQLLLKEKKLKDIKILEPPLAKLGHYLYLHKKHQDLVPKLDVILKEMKRDGTYQKILDEVTK